MNEAKEIASVFLKGYHFDEVVNIKKINSIKNKNGRLTENISDNSAYYILNDAEKEAFVIVGGDKRMRPILGFSENTSFNVEAMPCGLRVLLSQYEDQYNTLLSEEQIETREQNELKEPNDIVPLIQTRWGQSFPYNGNCPTGCPSGCVATAMAQIMKYYAYPTHGKGEHSYSSKTKHYFSSFDFANTTFEWDKMLDSYSHNNGTNENNNAVANIMRACGVSVGMDYTPSGSGAYSIDIPYPLINFFSYNKNIACLQRNYFKPLEWYSIVFQELEAGRPVLYCGVDSRGEGGHAFIVDGYRKSDGLFHVNWGWDGDADSYYSLDALDPNKYIFSLDQDMIIGFTPKDLETPMDVFYANSFIINNILKADARVDCSIINVYNFSSSCATTVSGSYFDGYIGIGLYDSDMNYIKTITEKNTPIMRFHNNYVDGISTVNFSFVIPATDLLEGQTYYIAPCVRSESSNVPTRIRTSGGLTDFYALSVDGGGQDDTEVITSVVFLEDFEKSPENKGWIQEQIRGDVYWEQIASADPLPVQGKGLIFLKPHNGVGAYSATSARLISPEIAADNANEYVLELCYQDRSLSNVFSGQINILLDDGCNHEWKTIFKQKVISPNEWAKIKIPFESLNKFRIAVEGNIVSDGKIYLDDLKISSKSIITSIPKTDGTISATYDYFTPSGIRRSGMTTGLNIVKGSNGSTKKVYNR